MRQITRDVLAQAARGILRDVVSGEIVPLHGELEALMVVCRARGLEELAEELARLARDRHITSKTVTTRPST